MKRHSRLAIYSVALLLITITLAANALAQQPLDRNKVPAPGKLPPLEVPRWSKMVLSNGATLIISERHNLPLVSFSITYVGGADQFEPA